MVNIKQIAGKIKAHHAVGSLRTVASKCPQLATSGGKPMPKNDKVLSSPRRPAILSGNEVFNGCMA
jgi:hypothetical protein